MANYTKIAIRGATATLIMSACATAVAYIIRIVLAHGLSPSELGLFYAVFNLIIFFLFFRSIGLGQALTKYVSEFKALEKYNEIKTAITSTLTLQLISSALLSIALFLLADTLAKNYFKNLQASLFVKLLIVYIMLSIVFITMKGLFRGYKKMFILSSTELSKNLIVLALIVLFLKLNYGVLSPVLAYVFVFPIILAIYLPFTIKYFNFLKYKLVNQKAIAKKLLLFGAPVITTGVGNKIIGYLDTFILTYFRDLSEVGIYNIVLPSALIFLFFGTAISAILFPLSSELWAKNDKKKLAEGIRLLYRYVFVFTIPILLTILIFSEFFINLFFGIDYIAGTLALQILLIGTLFSIVGTINYNFISGIGRPKVVTKITFIAALVNIVLNIILIPKHGINGAAVTTSASYLLALVFSTAKVKSYIDVKLPIKEWARLIISTLLFITAAVAVKELLIFNPFIELVISFIFGTTIYLIVSYFLKIIDVKELKYYMKLALK